MKFINKPVNFVKKHKKKFIILLIILVVLSMISRCSSSKMPIIEVTPYIVEKSDIKSTLDVKGLVESKDSAEITSGFTYKVNQIMVKEGDLVEKGQVLATLETEELEDEIAMLKKQIEIDSLKINQQIEMENIKFSPTFQGEDGTYSVTEELRIARDNANTSYEEAKRQEDMKRTLYESGAVSKEELNQAILATENAKNQLDNAVVALERANHDQNVASTEANQNIQIARESLSLSKMQLNQKLQNLEDLKIKSPIDGVVTRVYAKLGRTARDTENNKPMFIVEDISEKYVSVPIGEYNIDKVKIGQKVDIEAKVLGDEKVTGEVYRISPTGEEESYNSSVRVVPVDIIVTGNKDKLLSGVSATCKILLEEKKNVINVPFSAIGYDENGPYVFEITDKNTLHKISVKTGLESNLNTEITSDNLKEGMKIVSTIDDSMIEAMTVNVVEETEKNEEDAPQVNIEVGA